MNTGNSSVASRFDCCRYQRHSCSRPRYLNYNYCAQHIVEDNLSPFTSCEYLSRTTGRKCPNPAMRPRKQNSMPIFCSEHLHELIVKEKHQKQKRKLRRKRKMEKASLEKSNSLKKQKLIENIYKYCEGSSKTQQVQSHDTSSDSETEEVHRPIKDDWLLDNIASFDTDADWDDFDAVNNEVYEPLRYADVLTPEEVVATAQSKLIRLQSLYIEQFKRLFHLLQERRRQYLEDRKKEVKDEKGYSGMSKNVEFEENAEVYALATCGRRTGVEALLRKRQLQKREHQDGKAGSLPDILEDPHQLLYKKCHAKDCPMPVCHLNNRSYSVATDDGSDEEDVYYCVVHAPLLEMTFDFPDITTSPEKMEVCDNVAEDQCPELPPVVVHMGSASASDSLSPVNVDDKSLNSPLGESSAISNKLRLKTEPGTQMPDVVAPPPSSCIIPKSLPVEKNLTELDMQYTVKRENLSEECIDVFNPTTSLTVGESSPSVNKENQNLQYANNAGPSSHECVDVRKSSLAAMSSAGENLTKPEPTSHCTDDAKSTAVLPFDDKSYESALISSEQGSTGDSAPVMTNAKSDGILPSKVHATPQGMLSDSKSSPIDINLPSTAEPGSVVVSGKLGDPAVKAYIPDAQESSQIKDLGEAEQVQNILRHGSEATDAHVKGQEHHTEPKSDKEKCDGPLQLCEITGQLISDTIQESSDDLQMPERSEDEGKGQGPAPTRPCGNGQGDQTDAKSAKRPPDGTIQPCEMTEQLISDAIQPPSNDPQMTVASNDGDTSSMPGYASEESERKEQSTAHQAPQQTPPQGVLTSPQRGGVPAYMSERGERKPSSAEEEMAVVSLLQLCTGHASDDTPSSSTEQE